ncbi:hypothetical protein GCM10009007_12530 [Formosimonas limnophila]|uniref:Uncharacterized protein n=1 Tax=Formosimonas limnophila TaxID=1384487 RepID=A0A8J3CMY3_9BURK|nr:hypothetical protein GCM10009007_12530 [Formosimonas limnophila]
MNSVGKTGYFYNDGAYVRGVDKKPPKESIIRTDFTNKSKDLRQITAKLAKKLWITFR